MKTWKDYKEYVKSIDSQNRIEMEDMESMAMIIEAIINQRNIMGYSQRDLASMCDLPQSTLARIETFKTTPNVLTLLKIMKPLGLTLTVRTVHSNVLK